MATKKAAPKTSGPVSGLGETIEQLETLTKDLATKLAKAFGKKYSDLTVEQLAAAYHYGVAERRHRKLARKVGKANGAAEASEE